MAKRNVATVADELVGAVRERTFPVAEVGINRTDGEAWPVKVVLPQKRIFFYLTRRGARELADLLLDAANNADAQCAKCAEVEDADIHRRSSRHWMHDYDEQAVTS